MSPRARGRKESAFPVETIVQAGASFTYFNAGVNFSITFPNLLNALGATGTIVQAGAGTATAILDIAGTVHKIRGIEDGAGILSSVSPQNGLKLQHNFAQNATGIAITSGLATAQPDFSSLLPGNGIALTKVNDVITITATGASLPSTLTVTVNQESDFPTAVAGVITLVANTTYIISNNITTANRFVFSDNSSMVSHSVRSPLLTYSGTATMFTGVNVNVRVRELRVTCPLAKIFDFSDTVGGTKVVSFETMSCVACATVGDIDDLFAFIFESFTCVDITTDGLVFTGANFSALEVKSATMFSLAAGFIGIDLGTAVSDSIEIDQNSFSAPSGGIGISGAASSANLSAGGFGDIVDNRFMGGMTAELSGITSDDLKWAFLGNQGIPDTRPDSLSSNTAGTSVVISSAGVGVKIGGTWVNESSSHFTPDLSGKVTYNGVRDFHAPITATVSTDPASGSNKDFTICVAINGSIVPASGVDARASAADRIAVTVIWQHVFQPGDFVELFLTNDTDTTNFDVTHAVIRVN